MLVAQKEKLQKLIELVDKIAISPDVSIEYFIPGVLVTTDGGRGEVGGAYIQFTYTLDGSDPHIQHMPLTQSYLEKSAEDLLNLFTFSLERFMEEIDSRQYGAQ